MWSTHLHQLHTCAAADEKPGLAKKHDAIGLLSMANSGKNSNSRRAPGSCFLMQFRSFLVTAPLSLIPSRVEARIG